MDTREPTDHINGRNALGAALRTHRMAKGLSLRALAKRIGLSAHGTLVDYEHGRRLPPEDLLIACEKALDVDDGTLRRLRLQALAERATSGGAMVLAPPPDLPPPVAQAARRGLPRRWLLVALAVILAGAGGAAALTLGTRTRLATSGQLRFTFEKPGETWFVLWGQHKARGAVTDQVHYDGTHAYQVEMAGASEGHRPNSGYVAFGTARGLQTLHGGMRVTMHLWSSFPQDGVRFFVYASGSVPIWAPETPDNGSEIPLSSGPNGWTTITWTVPRVTPIRGIGVQAYQGDDVPRVVAVDAVSW